VHEGTSELKTEHADVGSPRIGYFLSSIQFSLNRIRLQLWCDACIPFENEALDNLPTQSLYHGRWKQAKT
jgi:hypothetical protein